MRFELIDGIGEPAELAARLRALVPGGESVADVVAEIIGSVRTRGDDAVNELTARLDTKGAAPKALNVTEGELAAAAAALEPAVRASIERASENVARVARAGLHEDRTVDFGTHSVALRSAAVGRAAVYVPGGRAPYPSTVVMGVVTARAAGVEDVAVASPPGPSGEIDATVLAACSLAGARRVYRMGGAQAVAALAYGTESVAPVDVIVGPGNLYVQEAKRQVSDRVAIDGFAGPSDLVAVVSAGGDPARDGMLAGLDLVAQAEHGSGTLAIGIASDAAALEAVAATLREAPETGAAVVLVRVASAAQGLALAEAIAPEHLELIGAEIEALAPRVTRAGSLFVGAGAGAAFGDYIAGSNHVLPTDGAARFASALSVAHFRRGFTETRIADPEELARQAVALARAEGFELHARSMEGRIRQNQPR